MLNQSINQLGYLLYSKFYGTDHCSFSQVHFYNYCITCILSNWNMRILYSTVCERRHKELKLGQTIALFLRLITIKIKFNS